MDEPCKECGSTEVVQKLWCLICANCRVVREYNRDRVALSIEVSEEDE
jgi:hypothetical protein